MFFGFLACFVRMEFVIYYIFGGNRGSRGVGEVRLVIRVNMRWEGRRMLYCSLVLLF